MNNDAAAGPRGVRWLLQQVYRALAVVGLIGFVYHAGFHLSVIASGSMGPTLRGESIKDGDIVLSERFTYKFRNPRRWEVILYREPEHQLQVMKRVLGTPGETLSFDDKTQTFFVNDAPVSRPASLGHIKYLAYGGLEKGKKASCGDGFYVLGDDSKDSSDSRWLGPVKPSQIRARPWIVLWPPSHIRFVNP